MYIAKMSEIFGCGLLFWVFSLTCKVSLNAPDLNIHLKISFLYENIFTKKVPHSFLNQFPMSFQIKQHFFISVCSSSFHNRMSGCMNLFSCFSVFQSFCLSLCMPACLCFCLIFCLGTGTCYTLLWCLVVCLSYLVPGNGFQDRKLCPLYVKTNNTKQSSDFFSHDFFLN